MIGGVKRLLHGGCVEHGDVTFVVSNCYELSVGGGSTHFGRVGVVELDFFVLVEKCEFVGV